MERVPNDDADEQLRPFVFSIAYRMLGSVTESEDVVQETFLRIHRARTEGVEIESPKAYLSAVATRLAIELRSARARRVDYVGQWLPEPLVTEEPEAERRVEMVDSLSMAFLVLLERLSPVERCLSVARRVRVRLRGDRSGRRQERAELPASGAERVARFLVGLGRQGADLGLSYQLAEINGQPGFIVREPGGAVVTVLALDLAEGVIQAIRSVVNADKLRHLGQVAAVGDLMRRGRVIS